MNALRNLTVMHLRVITLFGTIKGKDACPSHTQVGNVINITKHNWPTLHNIFICNVMYLLRSKLLGISHGLHDLRKCAHEFLLSISGIIVGATVVEGRSVEPKHGNTTFSEFFVALYYLNALTNEVICQYDGSTLSRLPLMLLEVINIW